MKMKEVCIATGLTERAVRFYVQEQLVIPQSQRRGGRTWLDFSPADVDRLRAAIDAYDRLRFTDTTQADNLEDYAALLEREVACRSLPSTDQCRPGAWLNWESIWENLCMVLAVILAWRLYARLVNALSGFSDLFFYVFMNVLVVILPFVVLILPIALVLGSKAGKWLYQHFEYVP